MREVARAAHARGVERGTSGQCDGQYSIDLNQFWSTHPSALGQPLTALATFQAQAWYRDPPSRGHALVQRDRVLPVPLTDHRRRADFQRVVATLERSNPSHKVR